MSVDNGGLNIITTLNKNSIASEWQPSNFYNFRFQVSENIYTPKVGLNLIVLCRFFSIVRKDSYTQN